MDDDFNTPIALSVMFETAHEINRLREAQSFDVATQKAHALKEMGNMLGIFQADADTFLKGDVSEALKHQVETLIEKRREARANKNWQAADQYRDEIAALGVVIEDGANGTSWRVK